MNHNNVPVLTMLHEHVNTPQEHAHVCTIDMYTDGGGATDEWRHIAGWGCAVVHNAHGHITTHLHLGQLRLDEHRAVEERGSTNNDAELRGLLAAAREASKACASFHGERREHMLCEAVDNNSHRLDVCDTASSGADCEEEEAPRCHPHDPQRPRVRTSRARARERDTAQGAWPQRARWE